MFGFGVKFPSVCKWLFYSGEWLAPVRNEPAAICKLDLSSEPLWQRDSSLPALLHNRECLPHLELHPKGRASNKNCWVFWLAKKKFYIRGEQLSPLQIIQLYPYLYWNMRWNKNVSLMSMSLSIKLGIVEYCNKNEDLEALSTWKKEDSAK